MGIFRAPSTSSDSGLNAQLTEGFRLQIDALEDWLIRTAIVPNVGLDVDRTWIITPDGDVPWEGRDRLSLDGFGKALPAMQRQPFGWILKVVNRLKAGNG